MLEEASGGTPRAVGVSIQGHEGGAHYGRCSSTVFFVSALFLWLTSIANTITTDVVFHVLVQPFARQEGTPTTVEFIFDAATSTLTLRKPNMFVREDWSLVLESGPTEM